MAVAVAGGGEQRTFFVQIGVDGREVKFVVKNTFIDIAPAPPPLRRCWSEGDARRARDEDQASDAQPAGVPVRGREQSDERPKQHPQDLLSSACSTSAAGSPPTRSCSPRSWSPSVLSEAATVEAVPYYPPAHFQGLYGREWSALIAGDTIEEAPGHVEGALHQLTTIFVAHLPHDFTRDRLVELLNYLGFWGRYTFVYVIVDLETGLCKGQAFVDLQTHDDALLLQERLQGVLGLERCRTGWANQEKGLRAYIEKYRNSDLMHEKVEDFYRPALYFYGQRVPFPPPTKKLRAPRHKFKFGGGAPAGGFLGSPHLEDVEPRAAAPLSRSVAAARARGL